MKRICKCLIIILICFISINSYATQLDYSRIYYDKDNYYKSTWQWLDLNNDGIYECYYFNVLGYMYKNGTTPDGYLVNVNGEWVVDGVAQRKNNIEIQSLIDTNIATFSSVYSTKNYVVYDVKRDFAEELDNYVEERAFGVRNYIVSKDVDKKLLIDLQGQYL